MASLASLVALPAAAAPSGGSSPTDEAATAERVDALERRLDALEGDRAEAQASDEDDASGIDVGGAVRFTYAYRDFNDAQQTRRGDAGLDIFRINVGGSIAGLTLSGEFRFYPYQEVIHHGWVGYDIAGGQVQVGIHQVPFGLLPFASHSFWFGMPYYLGQGDDYDTGLKYLVEHGPWEAQLAFYKNGELAAPGNLERYSYDPVTPATPDDDTDNNAETNQFNVRGAYTFGADTACSTEVGVSLQAGQLYNDITDDTGDAWAAAGHMDLRCGRWNVQLQGGRYGHDPANPPGASEDTVTLGAFAFAHRIAAGGTVSVANLAYQVPIGDIPLDQVTCYTDYSRLDKQAGFDASQLHTTGCLLSRGPTFTYIDIIRGRNALFIGPGSLAGGGDPDTWHTRFNINLGYYF